MAGQSEVVITVISQKGTCTAGHKVGDKFTIGPLTPQGVCAPAFIAIYPYVRALMQGGTFPWAEPDGSIQVACPDAKSPLIFSLKRVNK